MTRIELIPTEAKKVVDAFVQLPEDPSGLEVAAPRAYRYEDQSGGVIEMLEKLQEKLIQVLTVAEKEATESKNAFELMMQDLNAQIDEPESDRTPNSEKMRGSSSSSRCGG